MTSHNWQLATTTSVCFSGISPIYTYWSGLVTSTCATTNTMRILYRQISTWRTKQLVNSSWRHMSAKPVRRLLSQELIEITSWNNYISTSQSGVTFSIHSLNPTGSAAVYPDNVPSASAPRSIILVEISLRCTFLWSHAFIMLPDILYSRKFSPGENFHQFCHLLSLVKFFIREFLCPVLMIM